MNVGTALEHLGRFMQHPAPGVVFGTHKRAGLPERVYNTRHELGPPAAGTTVARLKQLAGGLAVHEPLIEFYSRFNGASFCMLRGPDGSEQAALRLLPVEEWERATAPWKTGEMASFMEECGMYKSGEWRVTAHMPSEGMCLTQFFDGEFEGEKLAGRMCCIGLDGLLGFEEALATDFSEFAREFCRGPAAWFRRIGFSWIVSADGHMYGDQIEAYVPDVRGDARLTEWPGL